MHPAAHDCSYQIPNPGAGTRDCEGICSPLPSGQLSSNTCQPVSCVLPHYRPLCSPLLVLGWSALHAISTILRPGSPNGAVTFQTHSKQQSAAIFPNKVKTVFRVALVQITLSSTQYSNYCPNTSSPELFCFFSQDFILTYIR